MWNLGTLFQGSEISAGHSCYGWKWHFFAKKHYTIQKNKRVGNTPEISYYVYVVTG